MLATHDFVGDDAPAMATAEGGFAMVMFGGTFVATTVGVFRARHFELPDLPVAGATVQQTG